MKKISIKLVGVLLLVALMGAGGALLAEEGRGEVTLLGGAAFGDKDLTGESSNFSNPSWFAGLRGGYQFSGDWGWFADLGFTPLETNFSSSDADTLFLRTGLEHYFGPETGSWRWYANGGLGLMGVDLGSADFNRTVGSLGFGQRHETDSGHVMRWELRADHSLSSDGPFDNDLTTVMALFGYGWTTGGAPADSDGDGVIDRRDRCPGTPYGARVDEKGCPSDGDADGVFDGLDKCPDTPKGWAVDAKGCSLDSDGDGVADGEDACPDTPRGAKVDAKGCPTDSDGDGVWDGLDKCPGTPAGAKVDAKGCPLDGDRDGVFDGLDNCPKTPAGEKVDAKGCSLPKPAPIVEKARELVLEGVNFETNSAELTQSSLTVLDRVAASLADWPEIRVEIGGHTDSRGRDAYNLTLSTARAAAVRDYLISRGIGADRLVAKGYGETSPIATNDSAEGRARNRRVALKRLD